MSEKRIIRRRRAGSTGSDSEEEVVLSGASQEEGVSTNSLNIYLYFVIVKFQYFMVRFEEI